jgi:SPP1 family predicted phage head-tail adaptor
MAFRVAAGELRHLVSVEEKGVTRGSMGEVVEAWVEVDAIRCKIWAKSGKEAEETRKETGRVPVKFYARYTPGITTGHRLTFGSRIFDIITVVNVGELNRELEITAEERL